MKRAILLLLATWLSAALLAGTSAVRAQEPPKQQKTYRGLKFSVGGVKRVKEFDGTTAESGKEIVVVSTVIDRSGFNGDDFRGNECRLDRAKLYDAADDSYKSTEQQRRVTAPLRNEDGTLAGTLALPYDWSFEVPEGAHLKTFKFVFADEHVNTGGADPDENVSELSFDLE